MVKVLAVLLVLTRLAAADEGVSRFGFRAGLGVLPIHGDDTTVFSLGVGLEHPLVGHTRVLGEYEYLFTETHADARRMPPAEHGSAQRISLGLRHVLVEKRLDIFRLWVDGELGGGLGVFTDNITGSFALPHGFAGLRAGYDIGSRDPTSPAGTFVAEILVRMIAIDRGAGLMAGVGMYWSN